MALPIALDNDISSGRGGMLLCADGELRLLTSRLGVLGSHV